MVVSCRLCCAQADLGTGRPAGSRIKPGPGLCPGCRAVVADQWPVGGMFEVVRDCMSRFTFFAVCFSFSVLPCFFRLAFRGDLSDMMTPSWSGP
jgi:hypothetical protein